MTFPGRGRGVWILLGLAIACSCCAIEGEPRIRAGNIVFNISESTQSRAVQLATRSPYSHMGLVLIREGRPFALEAVADVRLTPLAEWARRGAGGRYEVRRLRDTRPLDRPGGLERLERAALQEPVISPAAMFESPLLEGPGQAGEDR